MLAEETQKKIWIIIVVVIAVIGLFWLIFGVFIDQAKVIINGDVPYKVDIVGGKTVECIENPCVIKISSGNYWFLLSKTGYKDLELKINVPIAGSVNETVEFIYDSTMDLIGKESEINFFVEDDIVISNSIDLGLVSEKIFFEEDFIVYVKRNLENQRHTLYYRELDKINSEIGDETLVTSFIRDLNDYEVFPNIMGSQKIILLDRVDEKSILYLVDLEEKSRENILEYEYIKSINWVPKKDAMIYEARSFGDMNTNIYYYNFDEKVAKKIDIISRFENIDFIDSNTLFAYTDDKFFKKHDIEKNISEIVIYNDVEGDVIKLKLSGDKKSAFVLIDDFVYEVRFQE